MGTTAEAMGDTMNFGFRKQPAAAGGISCVTSSGTFNSAKYSGTRFVVEVDLTARLILSGTFADPDESESEQYLC